MEETQQGPISINIEHKDIHSALHRRRRAASQLHANSAESVRRWLCKIEEENGKTRFIQRGVVGENSFMIAWCSLFQLQVRTLHRFYFSEFDLSCYSRTGIYIVLPRLWPKTIALFAWIQHIKLSSALIR
jgi:hypothetical protein